jgi:hypothetical protein
MSLIIWPVVWKVRREMLSINIQWDFCQPFPIPAWKFGYFTIYSITKLPRKTRKHDSIMVVVEKLTNVAHFIPMKINHKETNIA